MRNEQIKQFRFGLLSSISISCLKLCCATWLGCKINNGQLSVFLKSALLLLAPLEELVFPYSNFQLNPTIKTIALSSETKVPVVFFPADDILKKMASWKTTQIHFLVSSSTAFLTLQPNSFQIKVFLSPLPKTCPSSWLMISGSAFFPHTKLKPYSDHQSATIKSLGL